MHSSIIKGLFAPLGIKHEKMDSRHSKTFIIRCWENGLYRVTVLKNLIGPARIPGGMTAELNLVRVRGLESGKAHCRGGTEWV